MDRWFIIETQFRPDGDINFVKNERYTFANSMNYYYQRKAAYFVDTTYTKAAVMLCDANLNIIERDVIATLYKPTTVENTTDTDTNTEENTEIENSEN